jgi:hypothetical protein
LADERETELDVTPVMAPTVLPSIPEATIRTGEIGVVTATPGVITPLMVVVTNPTGSVVAVVWDFATDKQAVQAMEVMRE